MRPSYDATRGCYVLVLREPAWVARTDPPLGENTDCHPRVDGRIDSDRQEARVLQDDRRTVILEPGLRPDIPLKDITLEWNSLVR